MIRLIPADPAAHGPADVVLRMRPAGGQITVIADPMVMRATISLSPMHPGDRMAEDAISAAEVRALGVRLDVTVPEVPQARPATLHGNGGSVVIHGSAVITGGSAVAGNIAGIGHVGSVTIPGDTAGVWAEVRVPTGSAVYITAHTADVIVRAPVSAEIHTAGTVRTEFL